MSLTRADLNDLDKLYAGSNPDGSDASDVPEGKYQAEIIDFEIQKSQGGRPQAKFVYKIVGGLDAFIGKQLTIYEGLATEQNMGYFKKKMKRLKFDMPVSQIAEKAKNLVGTIVDIQVKISDDFVNAYINKLVKASPGGKATEESEEAPAAAKTEEPATVTEEAGTTEEAGATEETEEAGGTEEATPSARTFPTQEDLDKASAQAIQKLLKDFKLKKMPEGMKEATYKGVAKVLVAVMEDDKYQAPGPDLRNTARWMGLNPEQDEKACLKQIIKGLGG